MANRLTEIFCSETVREIEPNRTQARKGRETGVQTVKSSASDAISSDEVELSPKQRLQYS